MPVTTRLEEARCRRCGQRRAVQVVPASPRQCLDGITHTRFAVEAVDVVLHGTCAACSSERPASTATSGPSGITAAAGPENPTQEVQR